MARRERRSTQTGRASTKMLRMCAATTSSALAMTPQTRSRWAGGSRQACGRSCVFQHRAGAQVECLSPLAEAQVSAYTHSQSLSCFTTGPLARKSEMIRGSSNKDFVKLRCLHRRGAKSKKTRRPFRVVYEWPRRGCRTSRCDVFFGPTHPPQNPKNRLSLAT